MTKVYRPRSWFVAFLLLFSVAVTPAQAADPTEAFFPLSELEPGMRGYALTVVQGTTVEQFEVEILGVLPNATLSGDLILIKTSGSVIDRTGGIASGMSGSPVYIDGKLLGAIGYGFSMSDHTVGLVTPIWDMYRVLERIPSEQRGRSAELSEPIMVSVEGIPSDVFPYQAVAVAPDRETGLRWQEALGEDVAVAYPARTALMVSGLSGRSLKRLEELLSDYDVVPIQAGGAPANAPAASFEPGSALGVQLARGDVSIASIGTVTYVDENGFLAFGHPFFQMGDVDFITTTAYIHYTMRSLDFPFKIGAPLEPVGRLLQDRSAAIAGTIGSYAQTIPFQINVFDRDTGRRQSFRTEIVTSTELTTNIAAVVALEAIDRAIDRIGSGTARVIMQISGNELPKRIVRDNLYYSHSDIAATSLTEFLTGLEALVSNEFEAVQITNIRLDVEVEKERWTARIVEARPVQQDVLPGESVDVEVRLRPYRGEEEIKTVRLYIPSDVEPGEVTVTARSGGFGFFRLPSDYVPTGVDEPSLDEHEGSFDSWESPSIYSLEGLLDIFMNREKNNEVVVEFFPYYYSDSGYVDLYEQASYAAQSRFFSPVQANLATRYVIQGSDSFTLRIASPARETSEEEGTEDEAEPDDAQAEDEAEPDAEESAEPTGETDASPEQTGPSEGREQGLDEEQQQPF